MRNHRLLTTIAVLTTALTLSLSACGPDDTPGTGASTAASTLSSAAPSSTSTSTTAPAGIPSSKPSSKPSAAKSSATADCTANANHPGHKVINATVAWGNPDRIGANATKFICGPDVPDDGYYKAVAPNTGYTFAPGAKASLVGNYASEPRKDVSITTLLTHIDHCTSNPSGRDPYACYGNMYDIAVDGAGLITTIGEIYHP